MEDFFEELKEVSKRLCKNCKNCNGKMPTSPWDKMPEGCGLYGWLFLQREKIKQRIRKQKELLLTLQVNLKKSNPQKAKEIIKRISKIKKIIEEYNDYGSADW